MIVYLIFYVILRKFILKEIIFNLAASKVTIFI